MNIRPISSRFSFPPSAQMKSLSLRYPIFKKCVENDYSVLLAGIKYLHAGNAVGGGDLCGGEE